MENIIDEEELEIIKRIRFKKQLFHEAEGEYIKYIKKAINIYNLENKLTDNEIIEYSYRVFDFISNIDKYNETQTCELFNDQNVMRIIRLVTDIIASSRHACEKNGYVCEINKNQDIKDIYHYSNLLVSLLNQYFLTRCGGKNAKFDGKEITEEEEKNKLEKIDIQNKDTKFDGKEITEEEEKNKFEKIDIQNKDTKFNGKEIIEEKIKNKFEKIDIQNKDTIIKRIKILILDSDENEILEIISRNTGEYLKETKKLSEIPIKNWEKIIQSISKDTYYADQILNDCREKNNGKTYIKIISEKNKEYYLNIKPNRIPHLQGFINLTQDENKWKLTGIFNKMQVYKDKNSKLIFMPKEKENFNYTMPSFYKNQVNSKEELANLEIATKNPVNITALEMKKKFMENSTFFRYLFRESDLPQFNSLKMFYKNKAFAEIIKGIECHKAFAICQINNKINSENERKNSLYDCEYVTVHDIFKKNKVAIIGWMSGEYTLIPKTLLFDYNQENISFMNDYLKNGIDSYEIIKCIKLGDEDFVLNEKETRVRSILEAFQNQDKSKMNTEINISR